MGFFSDRFIGALFFGLVLFSGGAFAQSLEIIKTGENDYFIKAVAPPGSRQVLQASANLQVWLDLNDDISGVVSNRLEITGTARFFRLVPWAEATPIRLVLVGDSTVADFITNNGWFSGWGEGIHGYFKPEATVLNFASACLSTKNFLGSDARARMLAVKPDVVLVQFGMVDAYGCGGDTSPLLVTSLAEYRENLRGIVESIRDFNGLPILVTPPVWPVFNAEGKVHPGLTDHAAAVRQVAAQLQVHVVDLNQMSMDLFNRLGPEGSAFIPITPGDPHYTIKGAGVIAGLVVDALPASLSPYIKRQSDTP